ncbi:MAG: GDSL-type esterase/lipase family protein [Chryseotalea sp.]|jgi:lysophospholipase L1-like esterase
MKSLSAKKNLLLLLVCISVTSFGQSVVIEERVKMLALGDSYTIGQGVAESERWPVQFIKELNEQKNIVGDGPRIIATTGWRTDQLKSALLQANIEPGSVNLISLLIGVNNQYQGRTAQSYKPELEELLSLALTLVNGDKTKLFVLSIPDYGYTPFGQNNQTSISLGIDAFNAVKKEVCEENGILFIDITDISRLGLTQPDLVAGDRLHPSGKMYALWVERVLKNENITYIQNPVLDVDDKKKKEEAFRYLSPNPFQHYLKVNEDVGPFQLTIVDANGKKIFYDENPPSSPIDSDTWAIGMYFYQIQTSNETLSGRLLKFRNGIN